MDVLKQKSTDDLADMDQLKSEKAKLEAEVGASGLCNFWWFASLYIKPIVSRVKHHHTMRK